MRYAHTTLELEAQCKELTPRHQWQRKVNCAKNHSLKLWRNSRNHPQNSNCCKCTSEAKRHTGKNTMIEEINVCYIVIALEASSYKYIAASLPSKNRFSILLHSSGLQSKLCSAPMPALCIVPAIQRIRISPSELLKSMKSFRAWSTCPNVYIVGR